MLLNYFKNQIIFLYIITTINIVKNNIVYMKLQPNAQDTLNWNNNSEGTGNRHTGTGKTHV